MFHILQQNCHAVNIQSAPKKQSRCGEGPSVHGQRTSVSNMERALRYPRACIYIYYGEDPLVKQEHALLIHGSQRLKFCAHYQSLISEFHVVFFYRDK